ncbi:MAG: hypothetical protein ACRENE_00165 [Polyangiaceae bacterium]
MAGLLAGLLPALALWGFTVDDALISVRYAHHLAAGVGWRFNAGGPATDGVTPLPWSAILAPLARADALAVLVRARVAGLIAAIVTSTLVGRAAARAPLAPAWLRASTLLVYAMSVPVAAYAVSGMETPLCALLATLAVLRLDRPWQAAVIAGLASTLRPELTPWAFVVGVGAATVAWGTKAWRALGPGVAALLPFSACCAIRLLAFGRVAPLAVLAKPSDLSHGAMYAAAAVVVSLAPILVVVRPGTLLRSPPAAVMVAAAVAHLAALALAGGDWMPFARLIVPVVPSLCLAAILLGEHTSGLAAGARAAVAMAVGAGLELTSWHVIADARRVSADRAALIASARPVLGDLRRVAALDIGWVGAATDADVVDLAGLTDPGIAALPGGHTSKRVDVMFLLSRDPDAVVLYAPSGLGDAGLAGWEEVVYGRAVEQCLVNDPVLARHFGEPVWLPLGRGSAGYLVLLAQR